MYFQDRGRIFQTISFIFGQKIVLGVAEHAKYVIQFDL